VPVDQVDQLVLVDRPGRLGQRLGHRLGVRAAAVLDRDHPAVGGGELVGAHAERRLQRTAEGDQKAAAAAGGRCLLGHRAVRAELGVVPALGGIEPAGAGEHPGPAEAEFEGDLLDLGVAGVGVAGHQPRVVRGGRQQVAGAEVAGLQALAPGHPGGGEQRPVAGQQHHLGHLRLALGGAHHRDRPVPAEVTRQPGRERVGGGVLALRPDAEVRADLGRRATGLGDAHVGTGQRDRGGTGRLDRLGDGRIEVGRQGRSVHTGHCGIRRSAGRREPWGHDRRPCPDRCLTSGRAAGWTA